MPNSVAKNVLLTGPPGSGKTTVVRRIVEALGSLRIAGFYTQEVRERGQRVGFQAVGLGGKSAMLAHVDFHGRHRVGRYGVDLAEFDSIVEQELGRAREDVDIFVIDKIGKMGCMSPAFVEAVTRVLDSLMPVLATVAAKGGGVIAQAKTRPDDEIVVVTAVNRHRLPDEFVRRVHV